MTNTRTMTPVLNAKLMRGKACLLPSRSNVKLEASQIIIIVLRLMTMWKTMRGACPKESVQ